MTADFFAIREQAERLAALWRGTDEVRITSPAGTDLRATVRGREPVAWRPGSAANQARSRRCPAVRCPFHRSRGRPRGSSSGSGSRPTLGALDEPVRFEVRDGRAVDDRRRRRRRAASRHRGERARTPTTSARSASGSTRPPVSPTRSPRRRRRSAPSTSRSATRPTSTAGWSNATSTSMAWSWRRRSSSTAARSSSTAATCTDRAVTATTTRAQGPRRSSSGCAPSRVPARAPAAGDPLVVDHAIGATLVDPDGNALHRPGRQLRGRDDRPQPPGRHRRRQRAGRRGRAMSRRPRSASSVSAFEEDLVGIAPPGLDRVLLGISGADANDTAAEARADPDRPARGARVLGRVLRACRRGRRASTASPRSARASAGTPRPTSCRSRIRTAGRRSWAARPPRAMRALQLVRTALEDPASGIGPLAAIIVEPVQGNGGIVIPPDGFLQGLRALCDAHGVPLIFDEIQCGFGRTGRMWAAEHCGRRARPHDGRQGHRRRAGAVGGGRARRSHGATGRAGTHTSTFLGNAVNLAAGRAAIAVMCRDRLWERSAASARASSTGSPRISTEHRARRRYPRPRPVHRHRAGPRPRVAQNPIRSAAPRSAERAFEHGVVVAVGRALRERREDQPAADDR